MIKDNSSKIFIIGFLALVILIPLYMIGSLAQERRERKAEVVTQMGKIWGESQILSPAFISNSYNSYSEILSFSSSYNVECNLTAEIRRRGTYKIPLYSTEIIIRGKIADVSNNSKFLILPVSNAGKVNFGSAIIDGATASVIKEQKSLAFKLNTRNDLQPVEYEIKFKISGIEKINFLPVSNEGTIKITSNWKDPNFNGSILPAERTIDSEGFSATWKFSSSAGIAEKTQLMNLLFSESPAKPEQSLSGEIFGVSLIVAVDSYHLVNRVIKYGILFIALTFSAFFAFEAVYEIRVHPIQYLFIGAALLLFYLLLLSLSEYLGFIQAYALAMCGIIFLVYSYSAAILKTRKRALILGSGLAFLYFFLLLLISLEEYSLLIGSVSLFIILGLIMYVTRNIDWYRAFSSSEKE